MMETADLESTKLFQHFILQDQAARDNIAESKFLQEWVGLCSDAIQLGYHSLVGMPFKGDKEFAIGTLAVDAFSSVIVAVRVGLWGDAPESFSILRSGVECCTQLEFVVREKMYETAVHEMDRKFVELDFDKIVKRLGARGIKIRKLHGLISEHASHATSGRLKFNSYERDGRKYIRFGLAKDTSLSELPVFYAIDVCISTLNAVRSAYLQDGLKYEWEEDWQSISNRYLELNKKYVERAKALLADA